MTNNNLLLTYIEKSGLKKKAIAKKLGLSAYGLSLKLQNKREFKASEIQGLSNILGLTAADRENIFFNPLLIKNQQSELA